VLLPATPTNTNGQVLVIGATGNVALYTPPSVTSPPSTATGSWASPAPAKLPSTCGAAGTAQCGGNDIPAVLLPSGNVLIFSAQAATGPTKGGASTCPTSCEFPNGGHFFEFNGSSWAQVTEPATLATQVLADPSYVGALMLLPNGHVLFSDGINNSGTHNQVWDYTPQGSPNPAWQPTITSFPNVITRNAACAAVPCAGGNTYILSGVLFNGMSQASYYGDDFQNATNYPIVQVTMNAAPNHVYYGRTHDHSSMGVAQTTLPVSTKFDLWACPQPNGAACVAETGAATLVVIANGIASAPVNVTIN
jgi:hypothetical protein